MEFLSNLAHIYHLILLVVLSAFLFTLYKTNSTVRDNLGKWTLYILGILPFVISTLSLKPVFLTDIYISLGDFIFAVILCFWHLLILFCLSIYWLIKNKTQTHTKRNIVTCASILVFGQIYFFALSLLGALANI